ncbi:hypothetical protein [Sphingomonas sp. KR3-1]|uniref:hypothetical protein n=1 Tax=Sphingomonas sp. KR3-1 TaxID=3156611 RepID=UPI0032B4EAE4
MPLTAVRETYRDVVDSAYALAAEAAKDPAGPGLAHARRMVAQAVARALPVRERCLIAPLRASRVPEHRECARQLIARTLQSRLNTIETNARWTTQTIAADPAGYRAAVADFIRDIEARIAEEIRTIHPLVLAAHATPASDQADRATAA